MNISIEELETILSRHEKWLKGEPDGVRANLAGAYLSEMNLAGRNLYKANLGCAILDHANLQGANLQQAWLRSANMTYADLEGADLTCADLHHADLHGADLTRARLRETDLHHADLSHAKLDRADLRKANLHHTDLTGACLNDANAEEANFTYACLEETRACATNLTNADLRQANIKYLITTCATQGFQLLSKKGKEITGWKKCRDAFGKPVIVELTIPAHARRSNATSQKCRASVAIVKAIYPPECETAYSTWDANFEYRVGATVKPTQPFDKDRRNECAPGIHYFMSRMQAEIYN